jgi:hybrid cluster-associated redox disulfide protein
MSSQGVITKDTTIAEALRLCPNAPEIFNEVGMGCCACLAASAETIEDGAFMHEVDVQAIVDKLNAGCEKGEQ